MAAPTSGISRSTRAAAPSWSSPGRRPVGVAFDSAVVRVRRGAVDARHLERLRVHPGRMAVPVGEEGGPIGHDRVEILAARRAVREVGHVPAATDDPRLVGMSVHVGSNRRKHALPPARLADIALEAVDAAPERVDMDVLEAGQEEPSAKVDDARPRPDQLADLGGRADRDDPLAADRDRLGPRPGFGSTVWTWPPVKTRSAGPVGSRHRRRMTALAGDPDRPARSARRAVTGRCSRARILAPMTTTVESDPRRATSATSHRVGSSISLIRDGDAIIVADPGLVASHARILDPLAALGVRPGRSPMSFLSHHHPDHTMNAASSRTPRSSTSGHATSTTCGWTMAATAGSSRSTRRSG